MWAFAQGNKTDLCSVAFGLHQDISGQSGSDGFIEQWAPAWIRKLDLKVWGQVGNESLPQVEEFKYLGVSLMGERRKQQEIDE